MHGWILFVPSIFLADSTGNSLLTFLLTAAHFIRERQVSLNPFMRIQVHSYSSEGNVQSVFGSTPFR